MKAPIHLFVLILAILVITASTGISLERVQNTTFLPEHLEPITPVNMHRVQQLAILGTGTIESIAWSPDSQQLAAAGSAGIRLFDVNDLTASPRWLTEHKAKVNDIVFDANGSRLISVSDDQTFRVWDVGRGTELSKTCTLNDQTRCLNGAILSVALDPDSEFMALGLTNSMTVLESTLNQEVFTSTQEDGFRVKFSEDGSFLGSSGFRDSDISIWRKQSSSFEIYRQINVPFEIWDFAFFSQQNMIAIAPCYSPDAQGVQVFDTKSGEFLNRYAGGCAIDIERNKHLLAISTTKMLDDILQPEITVINLDTTEEIYSLAAHSVISKIQFSPDGTKIAAGYSNGGIAIWNTGDQTLIGQLEGRGQAVRDIALVDDQLLSLDGLGLDIRTPLGGGTSEGDTLRLWDMTSGQEIQSWRGQELDAELRTIGVIAQIPNTSKVILRRLNLPSFYIWDAKEFTLNSFDSGTPYLENKILFNETGNRLAAFGSNIDFKQKMIFIWDFSSADTSHDPMLHTSIPATFQVEEHESQELYAIALHPTAPQVTGITRTGVTQVWDTGTGELLHRSSINGAQISDAAYSPDGNTIAISYGRIRLFEADTLEQITILEHKELSSGDSLTFNHSGSLIVSVIGSRVDGSLTMWDISNQIEPMVLPTGATELLFSRDDKLLISAGHDGTIRFWGITAD